MILLKLKTIKSVKQTYSVDKHILNLLETFRHMLNHCLRIGLQNNVHTLKKLSVLSYQELNQYEIPSYYKSSAISKAAGILSNRGQSVRRGINTKNPYMRKPNLVSYYGFKISNGKFKMPLGDRKYFEISLNQYVIKILSNYENDSTFKINSFTLTPNHLNISYSRDVSEIKCENTVGIDRNLRNITVGNYNHAIQYDISKAVKIT